MMPGLKVCLCFVSLPNFGLVLVVADLEQLYPATFVVNSPKYKGFTSWTLPMYVVYSGLDALEKLIKIVFTDN